jgi:hypothetical protein
MSEDILRQRDIDALCLLLPSDLLEDLRTKAELPKGLLYTYNLILSADEARIVVGANPLTLNAEPRVGNDVLRWLNARPCARAYRSSCQRHRKRESRQRVSG